MLRRYGIDAGEGGDDRRWRMITPAALPMQLAQRRIDPSRPGDKGAAERLREEGRAAAAVRQALRYAHIAARVASVRLQREPFEARGARAEVFAPGTRFAKERLWHVEIDFATAVQGPVAIGDGRYMGLGIMAPAGPTASIFAFETGATVARGDAVSSAQALRRAVMARVRGRLGKRPDEGLPLFFCGHTPDGAPADASAHEHLFFAVDAGAPARLLVIAPHRAMHRAAARWETDHLRTLATALAGLSRLVCGRAGAYRLTSLPEPAAGDALLGPARVWETSTPYRPTRHPGRGKDVGASIVEDVLLECDRRHLPRPAVDLREVTSGSRGGNSAAHLRLRFSVAVEGPIMLGRDSHLGGGLFAAQKE